RPHGRAVHRAREAAPGDTRAALVRGLVGAARRAVTARDPSFEWPDALVDALCARRGGPLSLTPLPCMSRNAVGRARWADGASAVVKRSARDREARFYRDVAPDLRAAGVGLPDVLALHLPEDGGAPAWIAVEDLPVALPRERWGADPQVVAN